MRPHRQASWYIRPRGLWPRTFLHLGTGSVNTSMSVELEKNSRHVVFPLAILPSTQITDFFSFSFSLSLSRGQAQRCAPRDPGQEAGLPGPSRRSARKAQLRSGRSNTARLPDATGPAILPARACASAAAGQGPPPRAASSPSLPRRAPPTLKETSSHFALFAEKDIINSVVTALFLIVVSVLALIPETTTYTVLGGVFGLAASVFSIADGALIYRKLLFNPSGPYQKTDAHDKL